MNEGKKNGMALMMMLPGEERSNGIKEKERLQPQSDTNYAPTVLTFHIQPWSSPVEYLNRPPLVLCQVAHQFLVMAWCLLESGVLEIGVEDVGGLFNKSLGHSKFIRGLE